MTASSLNDTTRPRVLHHFGRDPSIAVHDTSSKSPAVSPAGRTDGRLSVPVVVDLEGKQRAIERIGGRLFVADANDPHFAAAQRWFEDCARGVGLPTNFCGGLLIMRLYRLIAPPSEQTAEWMAAVYEAAAAYDFAFLALAHADDEADMTLVRDGAPTRFVTHPDTRAVDGINLLLAGLGAMQELLNRWPRTTGNHGEAPSTGRHALAVEIMESLTRALREASFPILLDRAGLGHSLDQKQASAGLAPIQVDEESLSRMESFTRHRAHTYFLRATDLATLLAGYTAIDQDLTKALDELFSHWGAMGAATDDLQDIFIDFAAGIHSICTVMAHLCVAKEKNLRPKHRQHVSDKLVHDQRKRLSGFFGAGDANLDRANLLALLNEIELRKALKEHFEPRGAKFAAAIHNAVFHFGFSAKIMMEIVSAVCRDPEFSVPDIYLSALESVSDEKVLSIMNVQVAKFIAEYFIDRYWPQIQES